MHAYSAVLHAASNALFIFLNVLERTKENVVPLSTMVRPKLLDAIICPPASIFCSETTKNLRSAPSGSHRKSDDFLVGSTWYELL